MFVVSFVGEPTNNESKNDNGAEEWLCMGRLLGKRAEVLAGFCGLSEPCEKDSKAGSVTCQIVDDLSNPIRGE